MKVQPHIPLIKFRKGLQLAPNSSNVAPEVTPAQPAVFEWWQKPNKYSRSNIDEKEIDLINSGGADLIFH